MRYLSYICRILFLLAVLSWSGCLIQPSGHHDLAMAEQYVQGQPLTDPYEMLPQRHHTWRPDPGGIIYDGYYPPPYMYRHYGSSGWSGYYPPYPPHLIYPPYYEPRKPWYEDEPPIPAGRLMLLVDPVEAQAYLNGYPLQRHPDLSYEVGLLQGEHQIEVKAEGYVRYNKTVNIQGGERVSLTIRLERNSEDQ